MHDNDGEDSFSAHHYQTRNVMLKTHISNFFHDFTLGPRDFVESISHLTQEACNVMISQCDFLIGLYLTLHNHDIVHGCRHTLPNPDRDNNVCFVKGTRNKVVIQVKNFQTEIFFKQKKYN